MEFAVENTAVQNLSMAWTPGQESNVRNYLQSSSHTEALLNP